MKTTLAILAFMAMGSISQASITLNCNNKETAQRTQVELNELTLHGVVYEDYIAGSFVVGNTEANLMTTLKGLGICQTGPVKLTCGSAEYNFELITLRTVDGENFSSMKGTGYQTTGIWSLAPLLNEKSHCKVTPR